ncbi:MAG: SDR family oxidoreductase [Succinivibrio sp.]|nr:SDR family oxidoreductase [Succinivibrio sp.]
MTDNGNPFSLTGKTVLVTGASSGIGRSIALACSQMGSVVVVGGRNETRLAETLALLEGGPHIVAAGDLLDESAVTKLVDSLPALDGVVHCAGIGQRKICKQLTAGDIDEVMAVNFKAPVLLQAQLLTHKKLKRGGSIVFISSVAATSPSIGNAVYSASKAALLSYADCLSLELAPRGIRVNAICPAMVWTDLIFQGGLTREDLLSDEASYPLKRYGQPEDIAPLAVYLLSAASVWMTGSHLPITGGYR